MKFTAILQNRCLIGNDVTRDVPIEIIAPIFVSYPKSIPRVTDRKPSGIIKVVS